MQKIKFALVAFLMLALAGILISSCGTTRKTGFALQKEIYEEEMKLKYGDEEPPKEIYQIGRAHV